MSGAKEAGSEAGEVLESIESVPEAKISVERTECVIDCKCARPGNKKKIGVPSKLKGRPRGVRPRGTKEDPYLWARKKPELVKDTFSSAKEM